MFSTADQEGGEKGDDCVDSFFTMSSCMQQNEVCIDSFFTMSSCMQVKSDVGSFFVLYNCRVVVAFCQVFVSRIFNLFVPCLLLPNSPSSFILLQNFFYYLFLI